MASTNQLKRYEFFSNFSDEFVRKIQKLGKLKELDEGEWLFRQEEDANFIYIIIEGKISLTIMFRDHEIDRLNPYMQGEILGWSALVKPHIYTMGAIAEIPSKVIGFEGKSVLALVEEDPGQGYLLMRNLNEVISERLINRNIQLMSLRT